MGVCKLPRLKRRGFQEPCDRVGTSNTAASHELALRTSPRARYSERHSGRNRHTTHTQGSHRQTVCRTAHQYGDNSGTFEKSRPG